jgi:hypothetical protein
MVVKTTGQSGFKVTVEGMYFVSVGEGKGKGVRQYSFDINLPSMDCALSIIKNKILDVVLAKKYPDYVSYRTHNIVNVVPFGNVPNARLNIWQMNRPTVESYVFENSLPVKLELYPTLMDLRNAVDMAERDPDRFARVQKQTEEDFKLTNALRELNPEMYGSDEEPAEVTPIKKSKAKTEDALEGL